MNASGKKTTYIGRSVHHKIEIYIQNSSLIFWFIARKKHLISIILFTVMGCYQWNKNGYLHKNFKIYNNYK